MSKEDRLDRMSRLMRKMQAELIALKMLVPYTIGALAVDDERNDPEAVIRELHEAAIARIHAHIPHDQPAMSEIRDKAIEAVDAILTSIRPTKLD